RLWNKWDLSEFEPLRVLEVSFAKPTSMLQLARKAEIGHGLTELSVCDLALRILVRATELQELQQAVAGTETFRLRRVDVVKEVPHFVYLRAVLVRLNSLRVLELTDVALDDGMLETLGECLSVLRSTVVVGDRQDNTAAAAAAAAASFRAPTPTPLPAVNVYGTPTGMSPRRYPPPPGRDTVGATFSSSSNYGGGSGGEVVGLSTLILG
ncbi:unnamed protein product, partial [Sphacelaria rigidula]